MVITNYADSPLRREHANRLSRPETPKGEGKEVCKQERKKLETRKHEDVKKVDKKRPAQNWVDQVKISDRYVTFKYKFVEMLLNYESMLIGHLGRFHFSVNQLDISSGHDEAIHSTPYLADPKGREFGKKRL